MDWRERTARLIGRDAVERLSEKKVAVFGLGGVGSYVVEALVRAGVGGFLLVDDDVVDVTNINRQLIATTATVGMPKAEAAKARAYLINPNAEIDARHMFYDESTADSIDLSVYDCVADCIDSVSSKLALIERARAAGANIVSCMGAGNKLDPTKFEIAYIENTSVCPLARVMRRELKKRGIERVKVVYSREEPRNAEVGRAPASISFVPAAAGLALASEIVKELVLSE